MSKKDKGRCSFCGNELPYEQLFQGVDGRFICFECIESAHAILAEQFPEALKGNNPQESKQRKEKNRAEAAEAAPLADGSYSAEGFGFNLTVRVPVTVEVKDGKLGD